MQENILKFLKSYLNIKEYDIIIESYSITHEYIDVTYLLCLEEFSKIQSIYNSKIQIEYWYQYIREAKINEIFK